VPVFFTFSFGERFWPLDNKNIGNLILLSAGIGIMVILDSWYNFARFGTPSVLSPYELIPNVKNDPIFQQGFMNFHYIPRHLEAMFTTLPVFINSWPYFVPSIYALAIWFTSPLLILAFKSQKKSPGFVLNV
jgi:hypothetical protein